MTAAKGETVALHLPFQGRWLVQNSPAQRVPSHGTDLLGTRFAIDFVAVDAEHRSAAVRDWRTVLATEPPERFVGFGLPVLAPCDGIVAAVHDGEPDHEARRSQLSLAGYALGQAARYRSGGVPALAGNHVIIARSDGTFVSLVHLRAGSPLVVPGDRIAVGQQIAECGNSGNSTEPHLHIQVTDSADMADTDAIPMRFVDFYEWTAGPGTEPVLRESGMPGNGAVVAPA